MVWAEMEEPIGVLSDGYSSLSFMLGDEVKIWGDQCGDEEQQPVAPVVAPAAAQAKDADVRGLKARVNKITSDPANARVAKKAEVAEPTLLGKNIDQQPVMDADNKGQKKPKFCGECGHKFEDGVVPKFCGECGHKQY